MSPMKSLDKIDNVFDLPDNPSIIQIWQQDKQMKQQQEMAEQQQTEEGEMETPEGEEQEEAPGEIADQLDSPEEVEIR